MRNCFRFGWLARTLAVVAMLMTTVTASADNDYWWRDHNGVEISNPGYGRISIKYLSYWWSNHDNSDDALHDLDVYLSNGKTEVLIFSHRGNHKLKHYKHNKGVDWNDGYGNQTYHNGASRSFDLLWSENSTQEKWVYVEIILPPWAWGKDWRLRSKGAWYYYYNDDGVYEFDSYSGKYDLGKERISDMLTFKKDKSGLFEAHNKLRVNIYPLSDLVEQTTVDVKLTVGKDVVKTCNGFKDTNGNITVDLPNGFDITKDIDVKADITVNDGRNDPVVKTISGKLDAYAKVVNAKAEYNTLENKVTVSWDGQNASKAKYVYVTRRATGSSSWQYIAFKHGPNSRSHVDEGISDHPIEMGKTYEYKVFYSSTSNGSDWTNPTGNDDWPGVGKATVKITPELNMELTAERDSNAVKLSWKIPSNNVLKDCKYQIMRCPVDMNVWEVAYDGGTLKASTKANESSATGNYVDMNLEPGTYKYKIVVDASGTLYKTKFETAEQKCQTISVASIAEMNATKGEYAGRVHLDWHMKYFQGTVSNKFTLFRRDANDKKSEWTTMYNTSSTDEFMSWDDDMALPGKYYEYKLQLDCVTNDEKHSKISTERTVIGFSSASGKVLGHITYGTGTAVEGVDVMARQARAPWSSWATTTTLPSR